jgi:hypothetical protein
MATENRMQVVAHTYETNNSVSSEVLATQGIKLTSGRLQNGMGKIVEGCSAKLRVGWLHNRRD